MPCAWMCESAQRCGAILIFPLAATMPAKRKARATHDEFDIDEAVKELTPLCNQVKPCLDMSFSLYAKHKRSHGPDVCGLLTYCPLLEILVKLCPHGLPLFVMVKMLIVRLFEEFEHLIPKPTKTTKNWSMHDFAHDSANKLKNILLKHLRDLASTIDNRKRPLGHKRVENLVRKLAAALKLQAEPQPRPPMPIAPAAARGHDGHIDLLTLMDAEDMSDDAGVNGENDPHDKTNGAEVIHLLSDEEMDTDTTSTGHASEVKQEPFIKQEHVLLKDEPFTESEDEAAKCDVESVASSQSEAGSVESITFDWAKRGEQKSVCLPQNPEDDTKVRSTKRLRKKTAPGVILERMKKLDPTLGRIRHIMKQKSKASMRNKFVKSVIKRQSALCTHKQKPGGEKARALANMPIAPENMLHAPHHHPTLAPFSISALNHPAFPLLLTWPTLACSGSPVAHASWCGACAI